MLRHSDVLRKQVLGYSTAATVVFRAGAADGAAVADAA
jgi:hypothetical protein